MTGGASTGDRRATWACADRAAGRKPRARAEQAPVRRPTVSLRVQRRDGRRAIVLHVDGGERVILGPVCAATMLSGAIMCAADVPPTIAGLPVAGYALLATAVWLLRRLVAAT